MAIAFKSAGAGNGTETSGAALNLACPATVDANDILIAHIMHTGNTTAPSTPANWTLLYGPADLGTGTPTARAWVYGKLAVGNEGGTTINFGTAGGTNGRAGRIYSFSGYVSGTLADVVPAASFSDIPSETDPQGPTVTTTVAGALAIALKCQDDNNTATAMTGSTGGTWSEATAEFVSTSLGPQGLMMSLDICTPDSDPGTVSGGQGSGQDDECSTIGFEIRPSLPTQQFTLTADSGSVAITGTAATLSRGFKLAAASGTVTITGTDVALKKNYILTPTAGSVTITGTAALATPFPRVKDYVESTFGSATDHNVSMPATVEAGELLLVLFVNDGTPSTGTPTGWTRPHTSSGIDRISVYAKVADGSEGGTTVNITTSLAQEAAAQVYRIAGWYGSLSGVEVTVSSHGISSAAPDSPALNPSGWDSEKTLWISFYLSGANPAITSAPSGYVDADNTIASGNVCSVGSAVREAETSSEDPGAWTLSLTSTWAAGTIGIRPARASSNVTMSADAGVVTITGIAASLEKGFEVAADPGSATVTGTASTLKKGFEAAADPGSVTITGTTATLETERRVSAQAGTLAVTGTDAALKKGRTLDAQAGSVVVTGVAATLEAERKITADVGSVALTGTAVGLFKGRTLAAGAGAYAVTGTVASLEKGFEVAAAPGAIALTGTAASLEKGFKVSAVAGTYAVAGTAASLEKGFELAADSGSIVITGIDAELVSTSSNVAFPVDVGSVIITGIDAEFSLSRAAPPGATRRQHRRFKQNAEVVLLGRPAVSGTSLEVRISGTAEGYVSDVGDLRAVTNMFGAAAAATVRLVNSHAASTSTGVFSFPKSVAVRVEFGVITSTEVGEAAAQASSSAAPIVRRRGAAEAGAARAEAVSNPSDREMALLALQVIRDRRRRRARLTR